MEGHRHTRIYTALVHDGRSDLIVADVVAAIEDGHFPLLLTNVQTIWSSCLRSSWRGTLQQYVGRLHQLHAGKRIVRVYDYVDGSVPVLNRMYENRVKAYEAVGYSVTPPAGEPKAQADLRLATIERIAVQAVIAFEEARGCKVESVEGDTRGFDLISRHALSNTEGERGATRFIEIKGRAAVGEIALTANNTKQPCGWAMTTGYMSSSTAPRNRRSPRFTTPHALIGSRSQRLIATA